MDNRDQHAINQLFGKLADVEQRSPERDREAEDFIRNRVADQPGAPYYMAQTIIVQEQALEAAQARIQELEDDLARRPSGGGFFSALFGSGGNRQAPRSAYAHHPRMSHRQDDPYASRRGGGGFLAGAAQTAMGVAGGVLLGNAIAGMFSGGDAQAAESGGADAGADSGGADTGGADSGFDGGDFGGFGDEF